MRTLTTVLALAALLALTATLPAIAQDAPTRERYVRKLEPVCKKDTARNVASSKGCATKVVRGKLAPAARQFTRATRAYSRTLKIILRTPQPATVTALGFRHCLIKPRKFI